MTPHAHPLPHAHPHSLQSTAAFAAALVAVLSSASGIGASTAWAQTPVAAVAPGAGDSLRRHVVDPTVPPPGFGKAGSAAFDTGTTPAPVASRLQMIVRGPGESRFALINGDTIRVGDRVPHDGGAARVVGITDAAVTLERNGSRYTLELVPGASAAVRCAAGTRTNTRCQPQPGDG